MPLDPNQTKGHILIKGSMRARARQGQWRGGARGRKRRSVDFPHPPSPRGSRTLSNGSMGRFLSTQMPEYTTSTRTELPALTAAYFPLPFTHTLCLDLDILSNRQQTRQRFQVRWPTLSFTPFPSLLLHQNGFFSYPFHLFFPLRLSRVLYLSDADGPSSLLPSKVETSK